jgi:hypothetical protein
LVRARALLAAAPPRPVVGRQGPSLVLAASLALVVGAAGASAALRSGALNDPEPAAAPIVAPRLPPKVASAPAVALPQARVLPRRTSRPAAHDSSYAAEVALLSRAHVAYAGRDFAKALVLVAQHERRFPDARLAEEREALRVCLLGDSGRTREARRAAARFAESFPRSVFLTRLHDVAP